MEPASISIDDQTFTSDREDVMPLSALRILDGERPAILTCWKPSKEELEEINRTGRVWVTVLGERLVPLCVMGIDPRKEASA